jgi:hypothetical protein
MGASATLGMVCSDTMKGKATRSKIPEYTTAIASGIATTTLKPKPSSIS